MDEPVCCCSVTESRQTLWSPMDYSTPGFPVFHCLLEYGQTHFHWVSDAIQPSHPLLSLLLPSIFPSIRVLSNESVLHIRWPKYCSFSISPSNEYSGLISFRIDWFDLFAVQGALKSLLQHHSLKASILWYSAFFIVRLGWIYNFTELQKPFHHDKAVIHEGDFYIYMISFHFHNPTHSYRLGVSITC